MARLIIDEKVREAFRGIPDSEQLFEQLAYKYGGNVEVTDTVERVVKFGSSDAPLFPKTLNDDVMECSKFLDTGSSINTIVTPKGNFIQVTSGALAGLKALLLYTVICNSTLGQVILHVMREYGKKLDDPNHEITPYQVYEDGKLVKYTNLTNYIVEYVSRYFSCTIK